MLALGAMGCSETAGTGGSAGDGGAAGMGGEGGGGGTAALRLFIFDTSAGFAPLEGVQACQTGTTRCAITDEGGNATLQMPVDREISFTVEKEGYGSQLRADVIPATGTYIPFDIGTDASREANFEVLMSPYPMEGTGAIYAQADHGPQGIDPIAGATFEILGTTAKAYYVDEDEDENQFWSPSPGLIVTTTEVGHGGFVEVSPGEHLIEIGGAAENCAVVRGWVSPSENTIRVPVQEGHLTVARVDCD